MSLMSEYGIKALVDRTPPHDLPPSHTPDHPPGGSRVPHTARTILLIEACDECGGPRDAVEGSTASNLAFPLGKLADVGVAHSFATSPRN